MAESDPSSPDLEFYTSNRGARKLAYKGYQYKLLPLLCDPIPAE